MEKYIDGIIVIVYLLAVTGVGLMYSKKSAESDEDYFLGGRKIPWYMLGISGMATFIGLGGTALQSGWYYLIGAKGFFICLQGAVGLMLAFHAIYVAKWLRRSEVMTNAEWMQFRFGEGKQGHLARLLAAISVLALSMGMMSYFFIGTGKVLTLFFPIFEGNEQYVSLAFFLLVGTYTIAGGFYGVIYTDFFQSFLIFFLILYIAIKAFMVGTPEYFATYATADWLSFFPADGNWSLELPEKYQHIAAYVEKTKYLGILVVFWIANNLLQGFGSPFEGGSAQRYYAAKNESEASKVAALWIGLWSFRFLIFGGIGVLALKATGMIDHPENAFSIILIEYIPVGISGLILAALVAAGMSTMDSNLNASSAYFVNDIYKEYINKTASKKKLVIVGYFSTFALMLVGIICGWSIENMSSIWGWIVAGLVVGLLPPNILKWFWWRANGGGYAAGMGAGLIASLLTKTVPWCIALNLYETFIFVFSLSAIASIIGTLLTKSVPMNELVLFYKKTRPFGFWGPVRKECEKELLEDIDKENRRDKLLITPACAWHLSLFVFMSSILFKQWTIVIVCFSIFIVTSLILYKFWYKNLKKYDENNNEILITT